MTALHPGLRGRTRVAVLADDARPALAALLGADPIVNAVVSARLRAAGTLRARSLGGSVLGAREGGLLRGACYHGGNLIPIGGEAAAWDALATAVGQHPRICTSIVGRADAVTAMWQVLSPRWGPARAIRHRQPLLVLDRAGVPAAATGDPGVRQARPSDRDRYLAAAAAMFAEELGVSPNVSPGPVAFGARVDELIRTGHAFAAFDFRGQVIFKADLGAITADTCQVQGVWVRPDLRGRGIATAALADVLRHALTLAPTVSLYVNDFNVAARRVYAKLGMREHAVLSTVLL
jgi:predicted GNAT family acetyltransferase